MQHARILVGLVAFGLVLGAVPAGQAASGHAEENVEWYLDQAGLEEAPDATATVYTNDGVFQVPAAEAFEQLGERSADLDLTALASSADEHGDDAAVDHVGDIFLSEIASERDGRSVNCDVFTGQAVGAGAHEVDPQFTLHNGSLGIGQSDIASEGGGLHVDRTTKTTHFHDPHNTTWVGMTDFYCVEVDIPIIELWLTIHQSDITGVLEIG